MADDKDDDLDALVKLALRNTKRVQQLFVLLVLLLGGGGSTLVVTGGLERAARPNPFTSVEGDALEERIDALEHWKVVEKSDCASYRAGIQNQFKGLELDIRKDMPPSCWRNLIYSMVRHLEKKDIEFNAGEYCR